MAGAVALNRFPSDGVGQQRNFHSRDSRAMFCWSRVDRPLRATAPTEYRAPVVTSLARNKTTLAGVGEGEEMFELGGAAQGVLA